MSGRAWTSSFKVLSLHEPLRCACSSTFGSFRQNCASWGSRCCIAATAWRQRNSSDCAGSPTGAWTGVYTNVQAAVAALLTGIRLRLQCADATQAVNSLDLAKLVEHLHAACSILRLSMASGTGEAMPRVASGPREIEFEIRANRIRCCLASCFVAHLTS